MMILQAERGKKRLFTKADQGFSEIDVFQIGGVGKSLVINLQQRVR